MRKSSPLYCLPFLLLAVACSGKVVIGENGTNSSQFRKNADGTCTYGNVTVQPGASLKANDGCNTCTCAESGAACTEMACATDGGAAGVCQYEGKTYQKGESFKCADGCNTCSCGEDGMVSGTLMGCISSCTYEGKTYQFGQSFPSADGCNTCSCSENGSVGCTEMACATDGGAAGCTFEGKQYSIGQTFQTACNGCACTTSGVVCDAKACACPPNGTVIDCEPPTTNKPQCQGPEHDWLVANCPGISFAL